tara:strand:+ start:188579 stop:189028 length:450 start_codon:yes stop_codon:yes gene_type:complete
VNVFFLPFTEFPIGKKQVCKQLGIADMVASRLFDDQFSGGHLLFFKDTDHIDPGIKIGHVKFLSKNGGFQDLGPQYVEDHDFFGGIFLGLDIDPSVGHGVWIHFKAFDIAGILGLLAKSDAADQKEKYGVKVLHTNIFTTNILKFEQQR